jgi:hypothetical protein
VVPDDIPEHEFFEEYGPDFQLQSSAGNRVNFNDDTYVHDLVEMSVTKLDRLLS